MSAATIEVIDSKTILVDGDRYIRSWKGNKVSKRIIHGHISTVEETRACRSV